MITGPCKEKLTAEYIEARLNVLNNKADEFTKKFIEVYGEDYTKAVISWFERAKTDRI